MPCKSPRTQTRSWACSARVIKVRRQTIKARVDPASERSKQRKKSASGYLERNSGLNAYFNIVIHAVAAHTSSIFRNDFRDESRILAASRCCFGTTAPERPTFGPRVGLPMVSRLWHNGSQLLECPEKVFDGRRKKLDFLPILSVRGETQ